MFKETSEKMDIRELPVDLDYEGCQVMLVLMDSKVLLVHKAFKV